MTIARQKITELPSLDIEQKIFVDQVFSMFDWGDGAAFNIDAFEQLLYEGPIAGSEFLVYDANKLYLCFSIMFSAAVGANNALGRADFFNEGNALFFYSQNNSIAYEAVVPAIFHAKNDIHIKNLYFSRLQASQYNHIKFIGYRIGY